MFIYASSQLEFLKTSDRVSQNSVLVTMSLHFFDDRILNI
jgi:hypothetical protein